MRRHSLIGALGYTHKEPLYVNLGLPSGIMWATRNLDMTQPNGFAQSAFQYDCTFFSYGNITGYNPVTNTTFNYDWGEDNSGPYASTPGASITEMDLAHDIARVICGEAWRLPTAAECQELLDNTEYLQADGETVIDSSQTNKLVTVNGITGVWLRSKINQKKIFFACSGFGYKNLRTLRGSDGAYCSSTLVNQNTKYFFDLSNPNLGKASRFQGQTCRPVYSTT